VNRWPSRPTPLHSMNNQTILKESFSILAQNLSLSLRQQNRVISFVRMVLDEIPTGNNKPDSYDFPLPIVSLFMRFLPAFLIVCQPTAYQALKRGTEYKWDNVCNAGSIKRVTITEYSQFIINQTLQYLHNIIMTDDLYPQDRLDTEAKNVLKQNFSEKEKDLKIQTLRTIVNDQSELSDIFNHIEFVGSLMPEKEPKA
jgi:hypothetical protein